MKIFLQITFLLYLAAALWCVENAESKPAGNLNKIVQRFQRELAKLGGRETNPTGQLVANLIMNTINDLGDPFVVIPLEEPITVPVDIPLNLTNKIEVKGNASVSNVQLGGLSGLNITNSVVTLPILGVRPGTVDLGFYLPTLSLTANYLFDLTAFIPGLLPAPLQLYGAGPVSVNLSSTSLDVQATIRVKLANLKLEMTQLAYEIDIFGIDSHIDGLLSNVDPSGTLNDAVNVLLNAYAAILFNLWEANLHEEVTTIVLDVANDILANLTLADLIDIIGGGGKGVPVMQLQ